MTIQRPHRLNLVLFLTVISMLSGLVAADEHRFELTIEFDKRAGKSTPVRTVIDFDELLGGDAGLIDPYTLAVTRQTGEARRSAATIGTPTGAGPDGRRRVWYDLPLPS